MRTLCLAAVLTLAGCSTTDTADTQPVPFQTLIRTNSEFQTGEPAFVVIQSQAEAEAFLTQFDRVARFPEDVDFDTETVLGVLRGDRANSSYQVDIYAVESDGAGATAYALETGTPYGFAVITYPAHFVVTPKLSGSVELAPVRVEIDEE